MIKTVDLYIVSNNITNNQFNEIINTISNEQKEKALNYSNENNKYSKAISSLFLDKFVGDDIYYNEHNKPLSDNCYFNISHSNEYVIFAKTDSLIGVDIEYIKSKNEKLFNYTLSKNELENMNDKSDFILYWTSKESLVKCVGIGLTKNLKEIPALPINAGKKIFLNNKYYTKSIKYKDYYISVTMEIDFKINLIEIDIEELINM